MTITASKIVFVVQQLNEAQQTKLLDLIESMANSVKTFQPKQLLSFAGSIAKDDLALMQESIENDCNQIEG